MNESLKVKSESYQEDSTKAAEFQRLMSQNAELQANIKNLKNQLLNLETKNKELDYNITQILNSRSWKITKPIRKIASLLRCLKATTPSVQIPQAHTDSTKQRDYAICKNNRKIYINPEDERGIQLIHNNGNFNPISLKIWERLIDTEKFSHLIDIGCNYGEMILNPTMPKNTKLIAVEANPNLIKYFERSIREAKLDLKIIQAAVSKDNNPVILEIDHNWSGLSGIYGIQRETAGHRLEKVEVPALTITDIIEKHCVNPTSLIIKIDIEGHEVEVLKACYKKLEFLQNYKIMAEVLHLSPADLEWLLTNYSISIFNVANNELEDITISKLEDFKSYLSDSNYYAQDLVLSKKND